MDIDRHHVLLYSAMLDILAIVPRATCTCYMLNAAFSSFSQLTARGLWSI
jgi:hypothetical protein